MKTIASLLILLTVLFTAQVNSEFPPTPKTTAKEAPFVNSLGVKSVPVKINGGPTNGFFLGQGDGTKTSRM
jgi:hypothetical protein